MKKTHFIKTDHFIYRLWDRGIDERKIDKIINRLKILSSKRTINIVASASLIKFNIKSNEPLVIVSINNVLVTAFFVTNLYNYLKILSNQNYHIEIL